MRAWAILLVIAALLAGCADTAVLRVIEYDASAIFGRVGGCAVHRSPAQSAPTERVELVYMGERCIVKAYTP